MDARSRSSVLLAPASSAENEASASEVPHPLLTQLPKATPGCENELSEVTMAMLHADADECVAKLRARDDKHGSHVEPASTGQDSQGSQIESARASQSTRAT